MRAEAIKEFKRGLIYYKPPYWEQEEENSSPYYQDTLSYDRGKITYGHSVEKSFCVGVLFDSLEEFLRTPVKEIQNRMNAFCYYNSVVLEEVDMR